MASEKIIQLDVDGSLKEQVLEYAPAQHTHKWSEITEMDEDKNFNNTSVVNINKIGIQTTEIPEADLQISDKRFFNINLYSSSTTIKYYPIANIYQYGRIQINGVIAGRTRSNGNSSVDMTIYNDNGTCRVYGLISGKTGSEAYIRVYKQGDGSFIVYLFADDYIRVNFDVRAVYDAEFIFDWTYVTSPSGTLVFNQKTYAAQLIHIDDYGKVGIRKASPQRHLDVNGYIKGKYVSYYNNVGLTGTYEIQTSFWGTDKFTFENGILVDTTAEPVSSS